MTDAELANLVARLDQIKAAARTVREHCEASGVACDPAGGIAGTSGSRSSTRLRVAHNEIVYYVSQLLNYLGQRLHIASERLQLRLDSHGTDPNA